MSVSFEAWCPILFVVFEQKQKEHQSQCFEAGSVCLFEETSKQIRRLAQRVKANR